MNEYNPDHYRFVRNSGIRSYDLRMDTFIRWRWLAIAALVVALAVAGFTASDVAAW